MSRNGCPLSGVPSSVAVVRFGGELEGEVLTPLFVFSAYTQRNDGGAAAHRGNLRRSYPVATRKRFKFGRTPRNPSSWYPSSQVFVRGGDATLIKNTRLGVLPEHGAVARVNRHEISVPIQTDN